MNGQQIIGFEAIKINLQKSDIKFKVKLIVMLNTFAGQLATEIRQRLGGITRTGNLRGSIEIINSGQFERVIGSPTEYALAIEKGRKASPVAREAIEHELVDYVRRKKKNNQGVSDLQAAYMLASYLRKNATKPQPFIKNTFDENIKTFKNRLNKVMTTYGK